MAERETTEAKTGRSGGGDSGGGAYPNPHSGKAAKGGGFFGHGGQTDMAYHGPEQLGDEEEGANVNSATKKTKPGGRGED